MKSFKHLAPPRGADVTWRIVARPGGEGFLCVGDAAAVLDPASSHGVVRALLTGMAAAQHAVRVIRLGYSDLKTGRMIVSSQSLGGYLENKIPQAALGVEKWQVPQCDPGFRPEINYYGFWRAAVNQSLRAVSVHILQTSFMMLLPRHSHIYLSYYRSAALALQPS